VGSCLKSALCISITISTAAGIPKKSKSFKKK
jgi:hypothetical protein